MLHLPTLCHPAHCWHAHSAIGIQRPWISFESPLGTVASLSVVAPAVDGGYSSGTVSGGNVGSGSGGGSGIGLKVKQTKLLTSGVGTIPNLPLSPPTSSTKLTMIPHFGVSQKEVAKAAREKESQLSHTCDSPA